MLFRLLTLWIAALLLLLFKIWRILNRLPPVQKGVVAFFHPFADGGGGGERVLWCAVKAMQEVAPHVKIIIYVHEGVTSEQLVEDASRRFNISLAGGLQVVPLRLTALVLPETYPRLTLLGQAWGAARLGQEALSKLVPELFVDTTGWAFTFPLARLAGARVAAYVHYPFISSNMIRRVAAGQHGYNNDHRIAGSWIKSIAKLAYYHIFAFIYGIVGSFSQVTMVNSSWTLGHIRNLWWGHGSRSNGRLSLVFPPVDTEDLQRLPLDRKLKQLYLVSVAQFRPEKNHRLPLTPRLQFRPEKNHRLQLEAFAAAKQASTSAMVRAARLKIVGGCRNSEDEARITALKSYAEELGVSEDVDWCVNVPYSELKYLLGGAVGGLHTMLDEHFGISVVEYMAAGVIPIANDSGGPRADIVVPLALAAEDAPPTQSCDRLPDGSHQSDEVAGSQITGYLASTLEGYTEAITKVLVMDQRDRLKIAAAAQLHAAKFSTERFMDSFKAVMMPIMPVKDKPQC